MGKKDRRMLLWKRTERVREERVWEREKGRESVLKALTVRLCVRERVEEKKVFDINLREKERTVYKKQKSFEWD